jgi:hypothetical protein
MKEEMSSEWQKAIHELYKVVFLGLPHDKMRKRVIKGLTKQGIDKARAAALADWAIKRHQDIQLTHEERKRLNEIREFVERRLDEGASKERIVEELITQGLEEKMAVVWVDSFLELKERKIKLHRMSTDLQRKRKEKQLASLVLGSVLVVSIAALRLSGFFSTQSNPIMGLWIMAGVLFLGAILTILWVSTRL